MTYTTFPYCGECPTKAVGEFIVTAIGETRGTRHALCAHHLETLKLTTWIATVKPAKVLHA